MFVQITKEEFSKEVLKKAWYQTNNIIWTILFLYPLTFIIDVIYNPDIWVHFLIVRLITDIVVYGLYTFFKSKRYNYRILLHITFFLLSCTSAVLCNLVNLQQLNVYFLVYSAIILFFNIQVFWEPVHSIIQSLIALILLTIFFNAYSNYSVDDFVSNGGQFFFIVASISCLIPSARFKVMEREARQQLLIEKSNEQLKNQNRDIAEKNAIIDMQYERLLKMDEQKKTSLALSS
jgi:hypothetical protein